jgi:hypothetical protein
VAFMMLCIAIPAICMYLGIRQVIENAQALAEEKSNFAGEDAQALMNAGNPQCEWSWTYYSTNVSTTAISYCFGTTESSGYCIGTLGENNVPNTPICS